MTKEVTIAEVNLQAREVAKRIMKNFPPSPYKIALWGVPRGGIPSAYAIAHASNGRMVVVNDPDDAMVIIDDLTDSGKTMERYIKKYPDKAFATLMGKPTEWIIMPWEKGDTDTSADDIPTRLLEYIGEDIGRGGLLETPKRFLKAWKHFTSGYDKKPEDILKVFEDGAEQYDEMVLVKNVPVYSQCEHHLVPFFGVAHIAYIPDGKIVGLSKLSRLLDLFARRLQVQERLTDQVATAIDEILEPLGVAVVLECRHLCMESRGICQQGSTTVTSSMKGVFRHNGPARAEFLQLIKD